MVDMEESRDSLSQSDPQADESEAERPGDLRSDLTNRLSRAAGTIQKLTEQSNEVVAKASGAGRQYSQEAASSISKAGEVVKERTVAAGEAVTDAGKETVQGARRAGEVFSGADIRNLDDFTEAVARVLVGLHRDNLALKEQVTALARELEAATTLQAELSERLATLEEKANSGFGRASG